MSDLPPDNEDSAEVDALYRRMSAADSSQPGEEVRLAVLAYATRRAAQAARDAAVRPEYSWQRRERAWRRPAAFGALAAGILGAFMLGPRFSTQPQVLAPTAAADRVAAAPPVYADISSTQTSKEQALPAPAVEADAKVRRVPPDALQRQLLEPAPAELAAADTAKSSAPGRQPLAEAARAESSGSVTAAALAKSDAAPPAAPAASARANLATGAPAAGKRADSGPALWRAAAEGDLPALRALNEEHADLNLTDADGRTALMIATVHGRSQAVAALLDYGADPNIPDASGVSPLDAALAADESEIITALKRHGAR